MKLIWKNKINKELYGLFIKEDNNLYFQINCSFKDEQRMFMRIFNPSAVIFDPKELKGRADKDPTENNVMCYEWLSKQVKNQQSVD